MESMMHRTLTAALIPLAFLAGAAVGPVGANAVDASVYAPFTFTPTFPAGCTPLAGRRLDNDARGVTPNSGGGDRPGTEWREVVLYRLKCGGTQQDVRRSVLRRGPWMPGTGSSGS
jgi:hypothetical protein